MNDNKTVYFVEKEEFDKIGIAMSLGSNAYQLESKINKSKNVTENRLINLNNIISLNKIIHEESIPIQEEAIEDIIHDYREAEEELNRRWTEDIRKNFYSLARKILYVDQLSHGMVAQYGRNNNIPAFAVVNPNEVPITLISGSYFTVPTFEINSKPLVKMSEVKSKNFDMVDVIINRATKHISFQEEKILISLLEYSVLNYKKLNNIIKNNEFILSESLLAAAFDKLNKRELVAKNIIINPVNKDEITIQNKKSSSAISGYYGNYKNCNVYLSSLVGENEAFVITLPSSLGGMPVKTPITCISNNNPVERKSGWYVWEDVGFCIFNPKGIVKIESK